MGGTPKWVSANEEVFYLDHFESILRIHVSELISEETVNVAVGPRSTFAQNDLSASRPFRELHFFHYRTPIKIPFSVRSLSNFRIIFYTQFGNFRLALTLESQL